ncbi:pyridoxamine 5'-phosphate oxidase family protein [Aurantimonas sp. VKM B-3413]|uniref:pyridoxamine 5'-phosphate oxidase family protein n=1 Tax=Aurantimonas sp. VKM B-3413 TaxID=2779401 RepID=UPI001E3B40C5|nr:pyridoxamine 5'-phosphate oxidase family protein [Aurantimonas sp. VKM B-3413]MCB8839229.1 pyridoxamine 5'-phosphate oxidase family protein [Aurantimonas sp. VKM B-3413]
MSDTIIRDIEALQRVYSEPPVARALTKELDHLSDHYRALIEASPFVLLASVGPEGLDCSPRGDAPGFVKVADQRTLLLPDRRGNNRIDTLKNIVRDPRVALLFLVPGVGETLRVNGTAEIDVDPALLALFDVGGKPAKSVLRIHVERVYFQCQKALARSRLWDPACQVERSTLPTAGDILSALDREFDGKTYDAGYPEHMKATLY